VEMVKQSNSPDAAAARVVTALGDNNWLVRKAAALAAGELQVQQASDRLNERLNDPNTQLSERLADIFALHRLGDPTHSHLFEQTSLDPDKRIRGDTAFMLGLLGDKSAVPILVSMLRNDKEATVRLQAAEALWRLGDERGLDDLVGATVSMYPDDKMIALLALAEPRDTRMLGHVEGALTDDYPEVALVAARAAGMLGSDHGYGVALNGAKSDDPRQRLLAAMAFSGIGRADAQPILAKLLDDKDADVRLAAAGALLHIANRK
jgi:HEAT repeat protein